MKTCNSYTHELFKKKFEIYMFARGQLASKCDPGFLTVAFMLTK